MAFVWLPETLGILASASLLIALAAILAAYDDKAIFYWKGVTLNAVVSVISTTSKASLLYSVSQLISQWKWIIFVGTRRSLIDFERVDAASRGPMGSLELIWRCKSIAWLRLGALVVLLSIAADPLTQQLIQYKQRVVYTQDVNTRVNRAGRFSRGSEVYPPWPHFPGLSSGELVRRVHQIHEHMELTWQAAPFGRVIVDADFSIQSSILYGLQRPIQDILQQGTFNCPTGNCSWPSFESLAVRNRCTDVSGSLERMVSDGKQYAALGSYEKRLAIIPTNGTAFRLPNGLYLDNANKWNSSATVFPNGQTGAVMMATLGTANASETMSAQEMDTLIWSMSMIRVEPNFTNTSVVWPDLPLSAVECALFYCLNSYETTVSNGTIQEHSRQVAGSVRDKTSWQPEGWIHFKLDGSRLTSISFDEHYSVVHRTDLGLVSPESGSRFNISKPAVDSISKYYQSTFASELQPWGEGRFNGWYMSSGQVQYEPGMMQALFNSKDLNKTFTALAASMSNAIRTGADEVFDGVPISVIGLRGDITTFYRIVWPWITLHCFIVMVGIVFLGITIWGNKRSGRAVPMWRSSGLAIASCGEPVTGVLSGIQTLEEMWKTAKVSRVTLFDKNDGFGSSLEHLDFDPLEVASQPEIAADGTQ